MAINPEEIEAHTRAERRERARKALREANDLAVAAAREGSGVTVIDLTPNVVIESPNVRLWAGFVLFALSLLSGLTALTLGVFPEIEIGNAIISRAVELTNQIVSFLTGAFGLAVVLPNVPNKPGATS